MNRAELFTAAFGDAHREDYLSLYGSRFLVEAEALISMRLASYPLEKIFTDADRVTVGGAVYNLPAKTVLVRHVFNSTGTDMDLADETFIASHGTLSKVVAYVVRPLTIAFAGIPGVGLSMPMHYFGMPLPLVGDTDTNTLLNDYPQLYKRALQVSIFERAKDLESKQAAKSDVVGFVDEINRKVKKMVGGGRSSNPYNVEFRSSY